MGSPVSAVVANLTVTYIEQMRTKSQYQYTGNQPTRTSTYESHHPMHVKRGVVKSLYDRARRVVTTDAGLESENRVLLSNGYPQSFINVNSKEHIVNTRDQEGDSAPPMVVIPYVSVLS